VSSETEPEKNSSDDAHTLTLNTGSPPGAHNVSNATSIWHSAKKPFAGFAIKKTCSNASGENIAPSKIYAPLKPNGTGLSKAAWTPKLSQTIPPGAHTCRADVETVHGLIEKEFYCVERFHSRSHFLAKAAACNLWFNVARKNSSKGHKTPWEIVKERQANIPPAVAAWQPVYLDELWKLKLDAEHKRGNDVIPQPVANETTPPQRGTDAPEEREAHVMRCPKCGGVMKLVGDIAPKRTRSP
jgi:hypothetical protein